MILSFHPLYEGDQQRLCAGRDPDAKDLAAMRSASAVILPQGCRESLYRAAKRSCGRVFPNYDARFAYPGKIGQSRLFQLAGVPHPRSCSYSDTRAFFRQNPAGGNPVGLPAVIKMDWGGEGQGVFPLNRDADLAAVMDRLQAYETTGQRGFIIQEWIPTEARSLRVVVTGQTLFSYWRVMPSGDCSVANLACGGAIDRDSDGHLMAAAEKATAAFCRKTGINLAGFDFLFCTDPAIAHPGTPLFLEINYFFGRRGLYGSEAYYRRLLQAIEDWLANRASPASRIGARTA